MHFRARNPICILSLPCSLSGVPIQRHLSKLLFAVFIAVTVVRNGANCVTFLSFSLSVFFCRCAEMRLGGAPGGGDPLAMGAGNDYAELCDLGPSRWSSRSGYQQVSSPPVNSIYHHTGGGGGVGAGVGVGVGGPGVGSGGGSSSMLGGGGGGGGVPGGTSSSAATIRSNSFEAEDVIGPYGSTRIGNSTSSLRGRSGLYYSPPGTSYTIVERERPHSPHYYYNTAGVPSKGGSLPSRSSYLDSASLGVSTGAGKA